MSVNTVNDVYYLVFAPLELVYRIVVYNDKPFDSIGVLLYNIRRIGTILELANATKLLTFMNNVFELVLRYAAMKSSYRNRGIIIPIVNNIISGLKIQPIKAVLVNPDTEACEIVASAKNLSDELEALRSALEVKCDESAMIRYTGVVGGGGNIDMRLCPGQGIYFMLSAMLERLGQLECKQ